MPSTPPGALPSLEASLQRVRDAVARGEASHAQLLQAVVLTAGAHALDEVSSRMQRRLARRRQREERRRLRRERRRQNALPRGIISAAAAALFVVLAMLNPQLQWMLYVALGLAATSVAAFASLTRPSALSEGPAPVLPAPAVVNATPVDPAMSAIEARLQRVEAVGEKLLADLKAAPAAVREFVQKPEETVTGLVSACRELSRRERELRTLLPPAEDARLREERKGLEARQAAAPDEVVKGRLGSALQALDGQLAQRAQLATSADRFEAESTRILYTLENLRTQVLRARSADAGSPDVVGAGLRRSLEQIGVEMNAIAEALEGEHRGGSELVSAVVDVAGESMEPSLGETRLKER